MQCDSLGTQNDACLLLSPLQMPGLSNFKMAIVCTDMNSMAACRKTFNGVIACAEVLLREL